MEIGLYIFGEVGTSRISGRTVTPSQRLKNMVEEIVLAAAATQTKHIRLSSAVTVLGSEDPVRVFQQYSTLDNLTEGRAEIMVGRGAFTESFPLVGCDLDKYDEIFMEKLQLLMAVNESERISWSGSEPALPRKSAKP